MLFLTKNFLTPFVLYKMNNVLLKEHSPKIVSIVSSMTVLWVGGGTRYGKMLNCSLPVVRRLYRMAPGERGPDAPDRRGGA